MTKTALLSGITGQDGSYLAEFLLDKGYKVAGIIRRASSFNTGRIDHLMTNENLTLYHGDLTDAASLVRVMQLAMPDEIYNLGAQSHVRVSFDMPSYTYDTIANGTLNILTAARQIVPHARFYQASSSEMFGSSPGPQDEWTKFKPCSPYGCAKVAAYYQTINFRESHGMFAVNGILFNHESPRRGETFVTRKITKAAARIAAGLQDTLHLGNLEARRDWGYAGDYVEAMWLMLQQAIPQDFVIGTGECHSVREWLELVFSKAGLSVSKHVAIDERLFRAAEVDYLQANATMAKAGMGWEPKVKFAELAEMMLTADTDAICTTCHK